MTYILCIWSGTDRQLNTFLQLINSFHTQIRFTLQIGKCFLKLSRPHTHFDEKYK